MSPIVAAPFMSIPITIDKCSRWRHFFARLGLVQHHTRTVTMDQLQIEINQMMDERLETLYKRFEATPQKIL